MSACRIKSVKFKNGGYIEVLPPARSNFRRVDLGWGEVVFRAYDGDPLMNKDLTYMCDAVKLMVMTK